MRRFTVGPDDIVVIVPRWIIVVLGLAMLLIGLTFAFNLALGGFVQEGLLVAVSTAVVIPINLLILYIVWRFYWYIITLSIFASAILVVFMITGLFRVAGAPALFSSRFIDAFLLATIAVGLLAVASFALMPRRPRPMDYDVESLDKPLPRRKIRRDDTLPHPHDPYWDDK